MNFGEAMTLASPMLLGLASDMEGRTSNAMALGAAKMQANRQNEERKAAISKLMGEMGLGAQKAALIDTLPVEMKQRVLLDEFSHREALSRSRTAAAASAARKAAQMEAVSGYLAPQTSAPVPSDGSDGQIGPTVAAAKRTPSPQPILSREAVTRAMIDPRLSAEQRNMLVKAYEFSNPEPVDQTAREKEIASLMDIHGISEQEASLIADGIVVTSRDPVTGEAQTVSKFDHFTTPAALDPSPAVTSSPAPETSPLSFGSRFEGGDTSFGVGGAGRGLANTVADVVGAPVPFPETQEAQADYGIMRESLLNTISQAYGRQPPSWVLQAIDSNLPKAGNVLIGSQKAQSQFRALAREFEAQKSQLVGRLGRKTQPKMRTDVEAQIAGIDAALEQINAALGGLSPSSEGSGNTTSNGVTWRLK